MSQLPAWTPTALATKPWDANLRATIDSQFSSIEGILDVARSNFEAIQNDDQSLKNGVVTVESLADEVETLFGGGVEDHGDLKGLLQNDHPQYVLKNGATILTGVLVYSSHPTFTAGEQLVDKSYVDNSISGVGGITDHGALTGKDDPADHAWAALIDGSRAFTGKASYASHPTISADTDIIDKKYAHDTFESLLTDYVTETGTSFNLGSTHNGKIVLVNNAADVTVTLPATGNPAGFNCLLIPINTGRILFDDDSGQTAIKKPATANLRSSEKELPVSVHQSAVGMYRVSGGLEDASIKRMEVMVCDSTVDVVATSGFNGNFAIIPDAYDGMDLVDVSVFNLTPGTGGDSTYQISRNRAGTTVNMLSTAVTIEDGAYNSLGATQQPVINNANDDVQEGDMIILNPSTVGSTPPKGLIPIYEFRRPA